MRPLLYIENGTIADSSVTIPGGTSIVEVELRNVGFTAGAQQTYPNYCGQSKSVATVLLCYSIHLMPVLEIRAGSIIIIYETHPENAPILPC